MEKIKRIITNSIQSDKGKDVMIIIIVILAGLSSFELGRLSKENMTSGIKIEYPDQNKGQEANVLSSVISPEKISTITNSTGKTFFASNRGSKYYSIGCSAGKTIRQENRVYFTTKEEAETAGYKLSSSCR